MSAAEIFDEVYSILIRTAGAHPNYRENFVDYHSQRHDPSWKRGGDTTEWRFIGSLGFGGKFWVSIENFRVSCYSEDRTPERARVIEATNKALMASYQKWAALLETGLATAP